MNTGNSTLKSRTTCGRSTAGSLPTSGAVTSFYCSDPARALSAQNFSPAVHPLDVFGYELLSAPTQNPREYIAGPIGHDLNQHVQYRHASYGGWRGLIIKDQGSRARCDGLVRKSMHLFTRAGRS